MPGKSASPASSILAQWAIPAEAPFEKLSPGLTLLISWTFSLNRLAGVVGNGEVVLWRIVALDQGAEGSNRTGLLCSLTKNLPINHNEDTGLRDLAGEGWDGL